MRYRIDGVLYEMMPPPAHIAPAIASRLKVMANLDKVPAKGALIIVTWPKVQKGLGFPARAFAILP